MTGPQTYFGLAGLFIVSDYNEDALGFPSGPRDIPLVLQDRMFDSRNQLLYLTGGMMDRMTGFYGDRIMVERKPQPRNGRFSPALSAAAAERLECPNIQTCMG
jgi:hypothetical protein